MYIYNVTVNIEDSIHQEWLLWMKEEHIPAMMATGKFSKALLTRVLAEGDTGITYAIQYTTDSAATLQKYFKEDAESLRADGNRFKGKMLAFRTELEVVHTHENV